MPSICPEPGCCTIVQKGRCDKHKRSNDRYRKTFRQRGYTHQWTQLSKVYRRHNPVCVICLFKGRVTAAEITDHIVPHRMDSSLLMDSENLCALCWKCHSWKTRKEDKLKDWKPRTSHIVLCGLPAVGKSTEAKRIADERRCGTWDMQVVRDDLGQLRGTFTSQQFEQVIREREGWLISQRHKDASVAIVSHPLAAMFAAELMHGTVRHLTVDENERQRRINERIERGEYGTTVY